MTEAIEKPFKAYCLLFFMESRYSRQEIYSLIGKNGQRKLLKSKVVIVGVGAIGTQSASLLTRAGVDCLTLVDRDVLELNNLQRQMLFNEKDVGKPKASQAVLHLKEINSEITLESFDEDLNNGNVEKLIPKDTSLILDCTDNLVTRFLINDYALKNKIPWIYSAAVKSNALLMNIIPGKTPCFACIFNTPSSLETCETSGVLNSTTSLIASLQASEAIKILLDKNPLNGLMHINLQSNDFDKLGTAKRKDCPACSEDYIFLNSLNPQGILKFCSTGNYQIQLKNVNLGKLKNNLDKVGSVEDLGSCIKFQKMLIFQDRCLVKAKSEKEAKSMVSKYVGN